MVANGNGCQVDGTLMDFRSRRSAVMGTRGMVACSQPLAAEVTLSSKSLQLVWIWACNA